MQRRGAVDGGGARQPVDVECACFGKARCTTCHVYVPSGILSSLPDPTEAELDALDTAVDRKDNSRLACCLLVADEMADQTFHLPSDYKPEW
ncbi:2Fe-2S ferredoxin [Diplonema papillatum]|nr:2Fe-2S ferredoxin [Diplonema papillatum]KAJ9444254.1 2Fe-2S ferredoxin [Diplonema papillatum]